MVKVAQENGNVRQAGDGFNFACINTVRPLGAWLDASKPVVQAQTTEIQDVLGINLVRDTRLVPSCTDLRSTEAGAKILDNCFSNLLLCTNNVLRCQVLASIATFRVRHKEKVLQDSPRTWYQGRQITTTFATPPSYIKQWRCCYWSHPSATLRPLGSVGNSSDTVGGFPSSSRSPHAAVPHGVTSIGVLPIRQL